MSGVSEQARGTLSDYMQFFACSLLHGSEKHKQAACSHCKFMTATLRRALHAPGLLILPLSSLTVVHVLPSANLPTSRQPLRSPPRKQKPPNERGLTLRIHRLPSQLVSLLSFYLPPSP